MAVVPIRIVGDPVLHTATEPVPVGEDGSLPADLTDLIANLYDTMDAANGVGLAANQIGIARRTELPLVIHVRDSSGPGAGRAVADCFELLAAEAEGVDVILHCFSATAERAQEAVERGWHVSFAGNVTYPNSGELREAAALVPDELLLVETDSPFLSPQPVRGKPNSPANVVHTAEAVADLRGVSYTALDTVVTANAQRLFGW